jgi:hypothetical protein
MGSIAALEAGRPSLCNSRSAIPLKWRSIYVSPCFESRLSFALKDGPEIAMMWEW